MIFIKIIKKTIQMENEKYCLYLMIWLLNAMIAITKWKT